MGIENKLKVIGISGVNGTGKSTISNLLLQHFIDYERIACDTLLAIRRTYGGNDSLLLKSSYTAWEIFGIPTKENIEEGFICYRYILEDYFKIILDRARDQKIGLIIDGVEIIPELFNSYSDVLDINLFLLGISDEKVHIQRVREKCSYRPGLYDRFNKHMSYVRIIQDFLIKESYVQDIQYIENDKEPKKCLDQILENIN